MADHLAAKEYNRLRLPTTLSDLVDQAQKMGDELNKQRRKPSAILLEPFKKLVEGLCKTSPAAGELIWGSISFILQMPKSNVKSFDEVSNFFRTMADEIGQIRLQETSFACSPLVQPVVEALYGAIIDFWVDAVKYYRSRQSGLRSRLKLLVWSPSLDKKFQLLMEEITKQRSRLHEVSSAQHNADFASFERSANQRRLRDWLNASDYGSDFCATINRHYNRTYEWILQKPSFIQWTSSTSMLTLFIHGIPGAGKTILSSWMIERALHQTADTTLVLYHYFKHTNTDKCTDVSAMRSFIDQLFDHFRCTQHPLLSQLELALDAASQRRNPVLSDLWPIFSTTLSSVVRAQVGLRITVIMDAMDECDSPQKLTTNILNLAHQIPETLKVLFTRRNSAWDSLNSSLTTALPLELEITSQDVHHDIHAFVRHTISDIPRLASHKYLRDCLSNVISSVANHQGMFLWAYFMCEEVKHQGDTIEERDEGLGLSLSVLQWIVNSPCLLQFLELQEGLRLMRAKNDAKSLKRDDWFDGSSDLLWSRQDIVDACANLVTYSGEGDSFRLVHLSAATFFRTPSVDQSHLVSHSLLENTGDFLEDIRNAIPILGQLCLKSLLTPALCSDKRLTPFLTQSEESFILMPPPPPSSDEDNSIAQYPLFHYAAAYWPELILSCLTGTIPSIPCRLLAELNITAFISDPFNTCVWMEQFIRQVSVKVAMYTLCQFYELDASRSEL
ncbi:hypothetical protein DXG01_002274 [Tephrocybe rancida]|nr:hypothetical protein DXG01_002274 [Tephrocybe rancida]